jgi:hypothetical protein
MLSAEQEASATVFTSGFDGLPDVDLVHEVVPAGVIGKPIQQAASFVLDIDHSHGSPGEGSTPEYASLLGSDQAADAPNDLAFSGEPAVLDFCRCSEAWPRIRQLKLMGWTPSEGWI